MVREHAFRFFIKFYLSMEGSMCDFTNLIPTNKFFVFACSGPNTFLNI